ncbi:diguanylate phosphodiesterase [Actibacterium mucosum KCTC 23349]|uniref:Diguanylate phosphodiesterase n=1 Tax=Actibacterium mucosum KCTC 23349 TaxID=1454373 RepID=A0A037ZMQ2_9RHOB|nr:EAL domain-containing protein [Actibacterium mucosum]KAJ56106.1 diguanylate phosphodiesterase [Actibacterium mucosum KCTC 23349]
MPGFVDPTEPAIAGVDDSPFSAAQDQRAGSAVDLVREALSDSRVALAFQPVMRAGDDSRPAFYEGLIRIFDDAGRVIPARDFIQQVEMQELGRQIDCVALKLGLKALRDAPDIRIAVNMSARSIGYPQWNSILNRGLDRDSTLAERLILEITESSAMMMPELVTVFMRELQHRGISFALDDFGAGYTSFRYLRDFYFDILKIDGQFIRNVASDTDNQVLTQALISIGRHFDMFTVAESVETVEDAAFLASVGIDCMQGYHFGAPTVHPPWEEDSGKKRRA